MGEGRPSARRDSEGGSWGAACASSKRATEEGRGVPLQAEPTPRSLQAQKARLARPWPRGGARPVGHLAPRAPRFPRHARHARRTPGPFHRCWGLHPTPPNGIPRAGQPVRGGLCPAAVRIPAPIRPTPRPVLKGLNVVTRNFFAGAFSKANTGLHSRGAHRERDGESGLPSLAINLRGKKLHRGCPPMGPVRT